MEAAVHVQSADEYDKAATVNSSADPVGQGGPVEQEAVYCDTATTPDNITESFDTHQSPLQKLPVTAAAISPYDIAPLPHAPQRGRGKQKRTSQSATVLTSTPHKDYLNGLPAKKPKPSKRLVFSVPSSEAKRATKRPRKLTRRPRSAYREQTNRLFPLLWTIRRAAYAQSVSTNHQLTAGPSAHCVLNGIMTRVDQKTQLFVIFA